MSIFSFICFDWTNLAPFCYRLLRNTKRVKFRHRRQKLLSALPFMLEACQTLWMQEISTIEDCHSMDVCGNSRWHHPFNIFHSILLHHISAAHLLVSALATQMWSQGCFSTVRLGCNMVRGNFHIFSQFFLASSTKRFVTKQLPWWIVLNTTSKTR